MSMSSHLGSPRATGVLLASAVAAALLQTVSAAATLPTQPIRATPAAKPVHPSIQALPVPAVSSALRRDNHGMEVVARLRDASTSSFRMIGVTWTAGTAPAGVTVESRFHHGTAWSGWKQLDVDPEEGPTSLEETDARDGTAPLWIDHAGGVEIRVSSPTGAPEAVKVDLINPGSSTSDTEAAPSALSTTTPSANLLAAPPIISREQWGADPSLRGGCWDPPWGTTIQGVFVHHTAGSNDYTAADSPAIVRGIYAYHVQSRGWCDIGYNFLVDRYGQIFEGRDGGWRKPIRGAHSGEYNVNTSGISLMGNFDAVAPPTVMKDALVSIVSWVLGSHYRNPMGQTTLYSSTTGVPKVFNVISGHRDSMDTSCPGELVYQWLPTLRQRVANRIGSTATPINAKWQSLGGESGWVGSPFTGERWVAGGRRTIFTNATIYRLKGLGAHEVHGAILAAYAREGGIRSTLGWPTSDTRVLDVGNRVYFQHGYITHATATNTTTVTHN